MADNWGAEVIAGAGIESVYDTAIAATAKVKFLNDDLDVTTEDKPDETLCGTGGRDLGRRGADILAGTVVEEWHYGEQSVLLEQAFGSYVSEVSPIEDHYDLVNRTVTSFTFARIMRDAVVHEMSGLRVNELTIAGSSADDVQISAATLGGTRARTGTTNTAVSLAALAAPELSVRMNELTLRIGDLGDALDASDNLFINAFSLVIARNGKHDIVNSNTPLPMAEDGKRDVTLSITMPRIDTGKFIDWKEANPRTTIQAELAFAEEGGTRTKVIRLPRGHVITAPQSISGPELQPATVTMMFAINPGVNAFTNFDFAEEVRIFEDD